MKYLLKTNTPIWTGGATGICDTIHESGIIGSLRWWYEVVLRGLDVFACDPTQASDNGSRCPNGDEEHKQWCNACNFFGMTGLQRKFKLNIVKGSPVYQPEDEHINIKPMFPKRSHGWYLGAGRIAVKDQDGLALTLTPFAEPESTLNTLEVLLCLLSKWGGIGARQQHGYGIFQITNADNQQIAIAEAKLNSFLNAARQGRPDLRNVAISPELPNLNNFFFAKIKLDGLTGNWQNRIDGSPTSPDQRERFDTWHKTHASRIFAPALKNQLRFVAFDGQQTNQNKLFGFIDHNDKSGAKVNVSHAYSSNGNIEERVWGEIQDASLRSDLYTALNEVAYWKAATGCATVNAQIIEWREVNGCSTRCRKAGAPCAASCTDSESFLKCLLS